MTTISQAPAATNLRIVAGDPFALTIELEDSSGDPLSGTSDPVVFVGQTSTEYTQYEPTITNPSEGTYTLSWTAVQTDAMGKFGAFQWSFSIDVDSAGPYAVLGGSLQTYPSYVPGSSSSAAQSVTVDLGENVVQVAVAIGASGVVSVIAGTDIAVNDADPAQPIVSVPAETFDAYGAATAAQANAEEFTTNGFAALQNAPYGPVLSATPGTQNESFGLNSIPDTATGSSYNVAVGNLALNSLTTGASNTGVGQGALNDLTSGSNNTGVGNNALQFITTASNNTGVGTSALARAVTGHDNVAIGYEALYIATSNNNVAIGSGALSAATTVSNNVAIGYQALHSVTTSSQNTAVGFTALQDLVDVGDGSQNTAVGYAALTANTAFQNTAVGAQALTANTSGAQNTAVGEGALAANTTGSFLTAIGQGALTAATGNANTAVGENSGAGVTSGIDNTIVGTSALAKATTGSENTALGYGAGNSPNLANATVAGAHNTFVGYETGPGSTADPSYTLALGASATTIGNGSVAIGTDHTGAGAASTAQDQFVLGTSNHTVTVPGALVINPGAFASGDKYLVFDSSTGAVHVSSLGPAS